MLIRTVWHFNDEGRIKCLLASSPPHRPSYFPLAITVLPSALPQEKIVGAITSPVNEKSNF